VGQTAAHELRSLFTPTRVGSVTLKNRIYSSGHAEAMAEHGRPTERLRRYHEAKARGGCALTIFGGSSSVHPSSPAAAWKQIANHDDAIIPGYRELADAVHRHGCLVFTQLTHLGRRAQSDSDTPHALLAPSQIPERVHREVPHELEPEQIALLVRAFDAMESVAVEATRPDALHGARFHVVCPTHGVLCAPAQFDGRYLGAIELVDPTRTAEFTDADRHAMTYVGERFAEFLSERNISF